MIASRRRSSGRKGGRAGSMAILSVRLAEDEGERQNEDLFVEIVADMHDPVAPVFRVASHDQRPDDASRAIAGLGEIAHRFAGSVDPDFPGIRAVEINLGHVGLLHLSEATLVSTKLAAEGFAHP